MRPGAPRLKGDGFTFQGWEIRVIPLGLWGFGCSV